MKKDLSILIIDDERMVREILYRVLSQSGHDTHTAEDGLSGLEIAQSRKLDLILLDWMMPGMDGMEVISRLKQDEKTRHIKVFMLTAKDQKCDIDKAFSLGINDYIVKPFNALEVAKMVEDKFTKAKDAGAGGKKFSLARLFSH